MISVNVSCNEQEVRKFDDAEVTLSDSQEELIIAQPKTNFVTSEIQTEMEFLDEPEMTWQNNPLSEMSDMPQVHSGAVMKPVPLEKVERLMKVSTGCGPSPDQEIEEIFANESHEKSMKSFTPLREIPSRSSKVSIGTSPPPQSISTQVKNFKLVFFSP